MVETMIILATVTGVVAHLQEFPNGTQNVAKFKDIRTEILLYLINF